MLHLKSVMKWRKSLIGFVVGTACLLSGGSVQAGLVHTDATATMTSGGSLSTTYLPIGTVVSASVTFNAPPIDPFILVAQGPPLGAATGTFTWNDGSPHVFTVNTAFAVAASQSGGPGLPSTETATISFTGTGPNIGGLSATDFDIVYQASPTNSLSALLLNGTIQRFYVDVTNSQSVMDTGDLHSEVSGSTTPAATPEPASLLTLGLSALGLVGYSWRRRRATATAA